MTRDPRSQREKNDFRGPYQQDNVFSVFAGAQTRLTRFCLWFNLPLFVLTFVLLVKEKLGDWPYRVLPWSHFTNLVVVCVLVDVWMLLTFTLGFTGAIGYELYWNPYFRAPSLRGVVGREEEAAMARVNREGGERKFAAGVLIRWTKGHSLNP